MFLIQDSWCKGCKINRQHNFEFQLYISRVLNVEQGTSNVEVRSYFDIYHSLFDIRYSKKQNF